MKVSSSKKKRDAAWINHCLAVHDLLIISLANALDPGREEHIDDDVDAARALLKKEELFNKGREKGNGRDR